MNQALLSTGLTAERVLCPCCGGEVSPLDLLMDVGRGVVIYAGKEARLTYTEAVLFRALVEGYPAVVTKARLLDAIIDPMRPDHSPEIKIIDVMVCKMRKRLDPLGLVITTSWGVGYALEATALAIAEQLRQMRFDGTRMRRHVADKADVELVRHFRTRGVPLTEIAAHLRLTYRAITAAIDLIEEERKAASLALQQAQP